MDSTRLLAPGVPIQVAGAEHLLRFSLLALKRLEDAFGTISEAERRILAVCEAAPEFAAPVVGDLGLALAAGTGLTPVQVLATYDGRFAHAVEDLWRAWSQAWPEPEADAEGKAPTAEAGTGVPSTTGPPSTGVDPTTSSGA